MFLFFTVVKNLEIRSTLVRFTGVGRYVDSFYFFVSIDEHVRRAHAFRARFLRSANLERVNHENRTRVLPRFALLSPPPFPLSIKNKSGPGSRRRRDIIERPTRGARYTTSSTLEVAGSNSLPLLQYHNNREALSRWVAYRDKSDE